QRIPPPDLHLHRTSIPPLPDEGQFFRIDPSRLLGTFAFARQTSRMSRVASTLRSCRSRRRAGRKRVNTEVKNGYPLGEILRNPIGSLNLLPGLLDWCVVEWELPCFSPCLLTSSLTTWTAMSRNLLCEVLYSTSYRGPGGCHH